MVATAEEKGIRKRIVDFFTSNIGEAFIYILITTGGSLMPVWGGLLLCVLFSLTVEFWVNFDYGQFYLYSAALFTPVCYQLFRNKDPNNVVHSLIFLLSIFLLLISAILFAGNSILALPLGTPVNVSKPNNFNHLKVDSDFLRNSSLILFTLSMIIAFIAQVIENKLRSGGPGGVQVSATRADDVVELNQEFDNLNND
jgi:hypothetical protein